MDTITAISKKDARLTGTQLRINWAQIDPEEFRRWIVLELEHDSETNVTADDLALARKVASAYLTEFPDFFTLLDELEAESELRVSRAEYRRGQIEHKRRQ